MGSISRCLLLASLFNVFNADAQRTFLAPDCVEFLAERGVVVRPMTAQDVEGVRAHADRRPPTNWEEAFDAHGLGVVATRMDGSILAVGVLEPKRFGHEIVRFQVFGLQAEDYVAKAVLHALERLPGVKSELQIAVAQLDAFNSSLVQRLRFRLDSSEMVGRITFDRFSVRLNQPDREMQVDDGTPMYVRADVTDSDWERIEDLLRREGIQDFSPEPAPSTIYEAFSKTAGGVVVGFLAYDASRRDELRILALASMDPVVQTGLIWHAKQRARVSGKRYVAMVFPPGNLRLSMFCTAHGFRADPGTEVFRIDLQASTSGGYTPDWTL